MLRFTPVGKLEFEKKMFWVANNGRQIVCSQRLSILVYVFPALIGYEEVSSTVSDPPWRPSLMIHWKLGGASSLQSCGTCRYQNTTHTHTHKMQRFQKRFQQVKLSNPGKTNTQSTDRGMPIQLGISWYLTLFWGNPRAINRENKSNNIGKPH